MRLNADQAIASLPQNGDQPLARFSIDGVACRVVAANGHLRTIDCAGTLTIAGRFYEVLCNCPEVEGRDPVEILTPRELEIALLVAAGHSSKEVARRLRISFHTVRVHLARTYVKLGLHKQTELAARMGARFGKL
jgi:DNA-binding CsgD family transcriptional regulator